VVAALAAHAAFGAYTGKAFRIADLPLVIQVLLFFALANLILGLFNLLPIPPLDGGHVAEYFVPYRHRDTWDNIAKYGWFGILAIAMIPTLAQVFVVPAQFCASHLYQLFGIA
jgi:Zn-dependent protease